MKQRNKAKPRVNLGSTGGTTNSPSKVKTLVKRDEGGRFIQGTSGGPGASYPLQVARLRGAVLDCVNEEIMTELGHVLTERAKLGEMAAIRLLLDYLVGRPPAQIDPLRMRIELRRVEVAMDAVDMAEDNIQSRYFDEGQ